MHYVVLGFGCYAMLHVSGIGQTVLAGDKPPTCPPGRTFYIDSDMGDDKNGGTRQSSIGCWRPCHGVPS